MNRRQFIAGGVAVSTAALAACTAYSPVVGGTTGPAPGTAGIITDAVFTALERQIIRDYYRTNLPPGLERHALPPDLKARLPRRDDRYDLVVLLQPTSPFRTAEDIDGTVRHCLAQGAPACVSITAPDKSPYWSYRLDDGGRMVPLMKGVIASRRQDLPDTYAVNGAVYVAYCRWLLVQDEFVQPETVGYVMPKLRSIDIDDEFDLVMAEAVHRWLQEQAPADQAKENGTVLVAGALG